MNKTINNEVWKDIKGYEGIYQISTHGNVKSLKKEELILKPRTTKIGYKEVNLSKNGKPHTKLIHRLVGEAFIGKSNGRVINHIDGVKTNNNLSNIEWCTQKENIRHAYDTGLKIPRYGNESPRHTLNEVQVRAIKTLIKNKFENKFIARHFGVVPTTISDIKRGKSWSWLTI